MSNLTTRAGKGSPLTNNELDANFTNLNADKVEIGGDLSGTSTAPNVAKIQGRAVSADAPENGEKLVWNGTAWEPSVDPTGEPIGHANKAESTVSFNSGTRTFTIAPVSASFTVWCKGVKHTYTSAQTVVIPDTTGLHFIYFNASGVLSTQMSYFTWEEHAPTAYIYWNATAQQAVYFGDERHGITLDWQTHEYLHRTRGAAIASGFGASGYTTTGAGATDADAQIDIGGGTFFDEDLQVDIVSTNTPVAGTWQQDLSGPARIPVLYLSGSSWVIDAPTDFPFKVVSGVPQYNLYSGGSWSAAPVANNAYFVSWILATHNLTYPVVAVISQAATNQVSEAEAMTFEGLTLSGFPSVEFRPLYKVIYQHKTSFANNIKASTIAVYDLRSISAAGVAAALVQDHGNLSGLGDDDHAQYLHVSAVRSPSAAVTNSFLPSQASQSGKYLTTDGSNPSWGTIPSGSLTFTGDVTGSGNTGSSTTLTLANSGVTAGTFTKVTVDAKGRVTNGASASNSDITTALGFTPENVANKAVANGYASLDSSGKVPSNQLPSYVDDVLEYANLAAFPGTGETGKIYVAIDSGKTYRWSGSAYVEISASPGSTDAVTEGSTNLYFTNARARAAVSASGSLSYSTSTGIFSYTQPTNVSAFTNDSGYLTGITGAQVTTALGYTPYNATNPNGYITGITSGMVTTALGYTPYNSTNPNGYITSSASITGNAATATRTTGYVLPDTGGSSAWVYIGRWSSTGQVGAKLRMLIVASAGFNANAGQNQITEVIFKTSNNSSSQSGSTGAYYADGMAFRSGPNTSSPAAIRVVQVDTNTYDFYGSFGNYSGVSSFYTVELGAGGWTNSATIASPTGNSIDLEFRVRLDSGNYNSYSLPLSGGTLSGNLTLAQSGTLPAIEFQSSGVGSSINWRIRSGIEGVANGGFSILDTTAGVTRFWIDSSGTVNIPGALTQNGNQVLHAGNYGSGYFKTVNGSSIIGTGDLTVSGTDNTKLPLTGGNVSGSINLTNRLTGILVNSSSQSSDGAAIAIQQVTAEGWTGIFADYEPYTGWGLWHDNPNNYFCFTAESATNGLRSFTVPSRVSGNRTAYEKVRIEQGSGDVRVGGSVYITTSGHLALHAGNYNSYSPTLTGTGASGTWGISITGNAATATSADQIDGVAFRNTSSNAGVNADTLDSNGITYYTSGVPNFTGNSTDGALYSQAYSASWQHQIAADYRSGQIALRGKNAGNWQSWRTVLDSGNYSSYAFPSSGGTIGGHIALNDNRLYLRTNGDTNHYLWNAADDWEELVAYRGTGFRVANSDGAAALLCYGSINGNYTQAAGSLRAPIFYDSDNTTYYADPNSISSFYGLGIRGDQSSTATENQIFFWNTNTTTSSIGFKANGGYFPNPTGSGDGYNTYFTMDTPGRGWVFREGVGGSNFGSANTSGWILNNGIWQSNASMRSPIFYDSNNTGYYMDPSAGGNVQGNWEFSSTNNSSTSYSVAAIELRESNQGGNSGYLAPRLGFHWGGVVASQISIETSGRISILNNPGNGYENLIGNILYGDASVRSPIFYDSNDTSYYGDFAYGSALKYLRVNGDWNTSPFGSGHANFTVTGTYASMYQTSTIGSLGYMLHHIASDGSYYMYGGRGAVNGSDWNWGLRVLPNQDGNFVEFRTSARAPIFYDLDNTGYYVDPSSTSTSFVANGNIECYARSASWGEGVRIRVPSTSTWGGVRWTRDRGSSDGNFYLGYTALDSTDDLVLGTNNGGTQVDNVIRVAKTGTVMFGSSGSTTNGSRLEIKASGVWEGATLTLTNTGSSGRSWTFFSTNSSFSQGAGKLLLYNTTSGTDGFSVDSSNNLVVGGNVTAYGSVSDRRLKRDIRALDTALQKVIDLKPVYYSWREDTDQYKTAGLRDDIGFIAQDVQEVEPILVREGSDGLLGLRERGIVVLLVKAFQEQNEMIKDLKCEVESLKSRLH